MIFRHPGCKLRFSKKTVLSKRYELQLTVSVISQSLLLFLKIHLPIQFLVKILFKKLNFVV